MAEGLLRAWSSDRYDVESAGVEATEVRPLAIRAMGELGIDISAQTSKRLDGFVGQAFDLAITVCDEAREACPYLGAAATLHWRFDDPAAATGPRRSASRSSDASGTRSENGSARSGWRAPGGGTRGQLGRGLSWIGSTTVPAWARAARAARVEIGTPAPGTSPPVMPARRSPRFGAIL